VSSRAGTTHEGNPRHYEARNLGEATPIYTPPVADLEQQRQRRPVPGNPFHTIYVWHEGPGSERLTDHDQTVPLADHECEHGRLPTDPEPCAHCHPIGARLYHDDEAMPPMPAELAAIAEPCPDRHGPPDPAEAPAAVAGQLPMPRDTVDDPPAEKGGTDPFDLTPIGAMLRAGAAERRAMNDAPDAHLEMDYEDRVSGTFTDDPHGWEDDEQHDRYDTDDESEDTWTA
jgi:hypothetical protein